LLIVCALAAPAFADDKAPPDKADANAPPATAQTASENVSPVTFHKGQIGVSARIAFGERAIATYDNKYYCGELDSTAKYGNAPVCSQRMPFSLGLEASYGVSAKTELVLEMRLGLERDFGPTANSDGPRPFFLAPGARFFFSEAQHAKIFVQPEVVFDFTGYKDAAGMSRGNDFGVRGLEGLWIDLHRSYGMYLFFAETIEMARWVDAGFEIGAGFQGRYP
jgi:hypothetical protein